MAKFKTFIKNKKIMLWGGGILAILIGVGILYAVTRPPKSDDQILVVPPSSEAITEPMTEIASDIAEGPDEFTNKPRVELEDGEMSNPLTGLPMIDSSIQPRRPIAVMLDNLYPARPQSALKDADVSYEILAEGRITRYLAVFYATMPEFIGPVRSARPYFVEKALEFDSYFVHVGGSNQALIDIKKYAMADIDGLSSGAFWRESHKRIPHNMYTSSKVILEDANRKGYRDHVIPEFLKFSPIPTPLDGVEAHEIKFLYKEPTQSDSIGYYTSYIYNNETGLYSRYTNGKPHLDETDETHLTCTNILVQYAKTKVIDNEGRLKIDLIGSGNGRFYSNGKMIEVTWEKPDASSVTKFYDSSGNELLLNPGKTWIQVFEEGRTEEIIN